MKKQPGIKGNFSRRSLPTGILMTVWRHPSAEDIDSFSLPPEAAEYLHALSHELNDTQDRLSRLEKSLRRIEAKLKRLPKTPKRGKTA